MVYNQISLTDGDWQKFC